MNFKYAGFNEFFHMQFCNVYTVIFHLFVIYAMKGWSKWVGRPTLLVLIYSYFSHANLVIGVRIYSEKLNRFEQWGVGMRI